MMTIQQPTTEVGVEVSPSSSLQYVSVHAEEEEAMSSQCQWLSIRMMVRPYEPRLDKTNKTNVRPAKTQISLGIRPVWSESSLALNG